MRLIHDDGRVWNVPTRSYERQTALFLRAGWHADPAATDDPSDDGAAATANARTTVARTVKAKAEKAG